MIYGDVSNLLINTMSNDKRFWGGQERQDPNDVAGDTQRSQTQRFAFIEAEDTTEKSLSGCSLGALTD